MLGNLIPSMLLSALLKLWAGKSLGDKMSEKIHRIVLTGGPCGGKTTALSHICDRLRSLGYNVYIVPEGATMFILGGVNLNIESPHIRMQTQNAMCKSIMAVEDAFFEVAKATGKPSVILYDRGVIDSKAFLPNHMWQSILDENEWSLVGLRDKRYDAVIHMTSASVGAKEFYTLENNAARSEGIEQAAKIDKLIQEAWLGHPHLRIIENYQDFSEKILKVGAAVCNVVGVPEPIETERKFLVKNFIFPEGLKFEQIEIQQTYLLGIENETARIRKRGQHGSFTYTHTVKRHLGPGKNVEIERMISSREYLDLLSLADPSRDPIKKDRICFLHDGQYFELDIFKGSHQPLIMLEAELEEENQTVPLPPWIEIVREVTSEPEFGNARLALKKL